MPPSLTLCLLGILATLTGFFMRLEKGEAVAMAGLGMLFGGIVLFVIGV